MSRYLTIGTVLAVFWLLLSGHYTPLFFFFAALSIGLVVWIIARMDHVDKEIDPMPLHPLKLLRYWAWMAIETFRSNIDMVKRVWRRDVDIAPGVRKIAFHQKTRMGSVIYANSITLTPGTVTLDIDEEKREFEVHAIDHLQLDDLQRGEMGQEVIKLEKTEK